MRRNPSRILQQTKQEKIGFKFGTPAKGELREHVPEFRKTKEGFFQYIKHNGVLFRSSFDQVLRNSSKDLTFSTLKDITLQAENVNIVGQNLNTASDFNIDVSGDLVLDADGGQVTIKDDGASHFLFDCDNTLLTIYDDQDTGDLFKITVAQHGATTIETVDDDATAGNLTLKPDGDLYFEPEGQQIYYNNSSGNLAANWSISSVTAIALYEAGGSSTDDYLSISVAANGATTMTTVDAAGANANLILTADGYANFVGTTLNLISNTGDIDLDSETGIFNFKLNGDDDDLATLTVAANGATTLATADSDGTAGHLTIAPNGDLVLDPDSNKIIINATDDLYLDGGGDTYITESSADVVRHIVGGDLMMQMTENGDDGNQVYFKIACVGFTQIAETFSDDSIIGSGGTDDTHIDFRHSNKAILAVTGAITNLNLIFPSISGNFQLVLTYDGDHTITNYKVYESDESAADGNADVFWPGGTKPDNTASGIDVLSFYWDSINERCLGVGSLAFATP